MRPPIARARRCGPIPIRIVVGAILSLVSPGLDPSQDLAGEQLDRAVERVIARSDPPADQVELATACLEALAAHPDKDAEREVRLALGIAFHSLERFAEAAAELELAAALARETGDDRDLAHSLWLHAVTAFHLGRLDEGVEAAQEGMRAAEAAQWDGAHWRLANILGLTQERLGNAKAAIEAYRAGQEPAARVAELDGDTEGLSTLLGNFGIASMNLGELDEALEVFQRALEIQRASGQRFGLSPAIANVGDVLAMLGRYDEAREMHAEALELRIEQGAETELARSYHSLGVIHTELGEFEEALEDLEKALEIRQRLELTPDVIVTLSAMSQAYAALDRDDEALESVQRGLEMTDRLELKGRRHGVLQSLSDVYASQGEHELALEALEEAFALVQSQRSIETRLRLAEFRAQFETIEREQEVKLLSRERELQELALEKRRNERNALLVGGVLVTIAACAGWFAWASLRRATRRIRKLEQEQMRNERLESIGVLAGGIAHDFNNILTIVLGNVSLLRLTTSADDPSLKLLDDVERGIDRGNQLSTQLLSLAKGGIFSLGLHAIGPLIQESAAFALSGSTSKARFDIDPRLWSGEVDAGQVQQLISNIVLNAAQSMPAGGEVRILAENTRFDTEAPYDLPAGAYVRIVVSDHGVGIDPQILERVFDPYFTTKQGGSGLGLALAFAIAKRHGGAIDVRPNAESGTLVEVLLPAAPDALPSHRRARPTPRRGQGYVLAMDDDPQLRDFYERALTELGYECVTAPDGATAVELAKQALQDRTPFTLAILDLTIPGGMGGLETVRALHGLDPSLPAIVASGYSKDRVLEDPEAAGFVGVLPKPFTAQALSLAIARASRSTESHPIHRVEGSVEG